MILFLMLILLCGSVQIAYADTLNTEKENKIRLKQVDLQNDQALYEIIKREISNRHTSADNIKYYSVYLSDYEEGFMVTIVSETYEDISRGTKYDGCYILDGYVVVFQNNGKYKLSYVKPDNFLTFNTRVPLPNHYDPVESRYFIFHDAYTWMVDNVGWVWVLQKDLSVKSKYNNIVVTVPKRTLK